MFYIWLIPLSILAIVLLVAFFITNRREGMGERTAGQVLCDTCDGEDQDPPP